MFIRMRGPAVFTVRTISVTLAAVALKVKLRVEEASTKRSLMLAVPEEGMFL